MRKDKYLKSTVAAVLAFAMLFALTACSGNGTGETATDEPAKSTEEAAVTEEPAVTEAPAVTEEPAEPTDEPVVEPTKEPKPTPKALDAGTDYYFDFTEYGEDELVADALGAAEIEQYEEGAFIYSNLNDPYVWILPGSGFVNAAEYKYIAIKVKATMNDRVGEYRFATTTDDRGWARVRFNYAAPGSWEIIVIDASTADFLNPDTMEGELTRLRIDPYNDEGEDIVLSEEYTLTIESLALFDTPEGARAYKGLYEWPDEVNEG